MNGAQVRRLAIAAVCLVAGATLYLTPGKLKEVSGDGVRPTTSEVTSSPPATTSSPSHRGTTSLSPKQKSDNTLPTPVRDLRLLSNTATTYTLTWSPSSDAAGIKHYVVLVNGYLAGQVTGTVVTFDWPASLDNILIQVAPVDGNGRQGEWRALVVIPPPFHTDPTTPTPHTTAPTPPAPGTTSPTSTTSQSSPATSTSPSSSPDISEEPSHSPSEFSPSPSSSAPSCSSLPPDTTPTATGSPVPSDPSAPPSTSTSPSSSASTTESPSSEPSC